MKKIPVAKNKRLRLLLNLSLLTALLAACQPAPTPVALDPNQMMTAMVQTIAAQLSAPSETPAPPPSTDTPAPTATLPPRTPPALPPSTDTPAPTATLPPRTPPALPPVYQTSLLKADDLPRQYAADSCQYLKNKWDSTKAAPGTVVMVVMYHGINKGDASGNAVTVSKHEQNMRALHEAGFEAITTQQLADFMYDNAYIPPRSVLLIADDRHFAEYFNDHWRPYYEQWGWPVVNAYIGLDERPDLWAENAALSAEGWVDYQAHGYVHNVNITNASDDAFIESEMGGAIRSLQKYMDKTPIAYIWPGGGFTQRAVEIGTQLGYKLGFTVNERGPIMYNWVPQADAVNAANPIAIPEVPAGNPLMTLPRYWSANVQQHLDEVRIIGKEAAAYAEQNKATELDYYDIVCAPTYGAIP
ncbi:MAG: polysaccharide deacetylase family protein [Anaerolineales bacterium]|nr:polysaccharide deacetylase family protein [Anaerolineales bacterium]